MSLRSEFIRLWNEFTAQSKKISELPDATTPLGGTELVEIVQGGVNKKVASSNLGGGGGGGSVNSVSGTPNRITSTGGTDPVIDIAAAYDTAVTTAINAKVTQTITNGVTTTAPSEDAVFDALALKADSSAIATINGITKIYAQQNFK